MLPLPLPSPQLLLRSGGLGLGSSASQTAGEVWTLKLLTLYREGRKERGKERRGRKKQSGVMPLLQKCCEAEGQEPCSSRCHSCPQTTCIPCRRIAVNKDIYEKISVLFLEYFPVKELLFGEEAVLFLLAEHLTKVNESLLSLTSLLDSTIQYFL